MAFKRVKGLDRGNDTGVCSSVAFAVGDVCAYDRSNNVIIKATSSTPNESVAGIVTKATTTADTEVEFQIVMPGDQYIADFTNNTAANQRYELMVLTDAATVNNTGTTATTGAFVRLDAMVGAAADKKGLVTFQMATSA